MCFVAAVSKGTSAQKFSHYLLIHMVMESLVVFVVHKTFMEHHSKTALQNSPKKTEVNGNIKQEKKKNKTKWLRTARLVSYKPPEALKKLIEKTLFATFLNLKSSL